MATRRLSTEDITGFGTPQAPAVPVPNPNTGNTGGGTTPNTGTTTTGISPSGGTMNFNPIPNNTPVNPGDAIGFVTNFMFGDQHKTGDPLKDMAQDTFNKIKQAYGHNVAWTWMMKNAWNQLGGYGPGGMREIMDKAGIDKTDHNRIINTYGTNGKYFDGLRSQTQPGGFFRPDPQWDAISKPFQDYQLAYTNAYSKHKAGGYQGTFTPPALPQGYTAGTYGTTPNFQATGTNTAPPIPEGYGGVVGLDPSTGKPYGQPAGSYVNNNSTPVVGAPPPAVNTNPNAGINPATGQPYASPSVTAPPVDQSGWDNWANKVQNRTPRTGLSSTNPFGDAAYRFKPQGPK